MAICFKNPQMHLLWDELLVFPWLILRDNFHCCLGWPKCCTLLRPGVVMSKQVSVIKYHTLLFQVLDIIDEPIERMNKEEAKENEIAEFGPDDSPEAKQSMTALLCYIYLFMVFKYFFNEIMFAKDRKI